MKAKIRHIKIPKTSEEKPYIRAAIYARYSSQMQKADSIEDQITVIKQMLNSKRIESKKWKDREIRILPDWILSDEAKSGKTAARDNYIRILDGIRTNAFDLLLVDNLSRATRDLGGMMDLYNEIKFYDKELVSASEGLSTEDPMAKTYFAVKGMVNDMENDTRSNCTKRGMIGKYLKGYVCGDAPYGYKTTPTAVNEGKGQNKNCNYEVAINPTQAEIVRRIYRMYASGAGIPSICKTLNREGVVWPSFPKGKGWSQTTVQTILTSSKYIGMWIWGTGKYFSKPSSGKKILRMRPENEWIYFRNKRINDDLIIVERELWDKVQEVRDKIAKEREEAKSLRKKLFVRTSENNSSHFLSGLIECKRCGGNMIVVSGRREGYYGCFNAHRKATCTNTNLIRAKWIEQNIMTQLKARLSSDDFAKIVAKNYNRHKNAMLKNVESREEALSKELSRLRAEINNLVEFIASGQTSEAIAKSIRSKEERVREIQNLLHYVEGRRSQRIFITPTVVKQRFERLQEVLAVDPSMAKRIIRGLLSDKIILEKKNDLKKLSVSISEEKLTAEELDAGIV